MESAHIALSTRSGTASVLAFAGHWLCLFGFRLLLAGLLRGWLLSFVQAWEGEIRYLVHRRRSLQSLFVQSQVIARAQKALAGYSTVNDKQTIKSLEGHLAQNHVAVHHKVTQQAVERMLEGCRTVLFKEKVANPGKAVAGNRQGDQQRQ